MDQGHDAAGNIIADTDAVNNVDNDYVYNAAGQLSVVVVDGQYSAEYSYDYLSRLSLRYIAICRILLSPSILNSDAVPLGDLTPEEIDAIQDAVDEAGRPIDVVGSAAGGNRGPDSDIDYTTGPASQPNFEGANLPGLDSHGVLGGAPDKGKPSIRFEPGRRPIFVPSN